MKVRKQGWINIYPAADILPVTTVDKRVFESRLDAINCRHYVSNAQTIQIEWEEEV
jgi:hypothetical protein